jgi:uncharacterized membrane protein
MFELIMMLEVLGFIFLALGIIPFKSNNDTGNPPLANKVLFIFVASIIFFSLAATSVSFDYNYCYISETTSVGATMTNSATCDVYKVEDIGLSYLNWGMGVLSVLVGLIVILIAAFTKNDYKYQET